MSASDQNPLGSRFAQESSSPGLLLWRVTNRWQAAVRRALAPHDLTHVQYVLLADLTWHDDDDGGTTQAELSQRVRADPMMVSQVVRALERKQLVLRRPDARDRRAVRVSATPEGAALARAATRDVEAADLAFFGDRHHHAQPLLEHLAALDADTSTSG